MKEQSRPLRDGNDGAGVSRRRFLRGALAAGAGLAIVPRHVLGGAGYVAPSGKVNTACIGVGSQGLRVMLGYLGQPDVQVVSVCDVNRESSDYPQWGENEFRDSVRRLLGGGDPGWTEGLSPDKPIRLTRSLAVTSGTAGREPCRRIVEAYYGSREGSGAYKGCTAYNDFRELLEEEQDIDAVIVGTTDHWHAPISIAAMKKGKHVFCQKPMTRTVHEARRMGEVARETGVATQVAVGNQASEATIIHWTVPARGDMPPVHITWYDGGLRPLRPEGLGDKALDREGLLFIGDEGSILCDFTGGSPRIIPESKMKSFSPPPKTLPRSPGNDREWIDACKGGKTPCGANFEFESTVTETILLGNVAHRAGAKLRWDSARLKATNAPAAERYVRPEYRGKWSV